MLRLVSAGGHADDLWLAGEDFAFRFDGRTWQVTETGVSEPRAFAVRGRDAVVLAGDGAVAAWDGRVWSRVEGLEGCYLSACVGPDGEVLIAEIEGTVITLAPNEVVVEIRVESNAVCNREAWMAITTLAQHVADRLGAGPPQ
jgi:hypothetical protein